jgi:two-component system chemotaxis sensor kinase CheA
MDSIGSREAAKVTANASPYSPQITREFILEAMEHLERVEPNLLRLERDPRNRDIVDEIFRSLHTIKGGSSFLGFGSITELSHKLESILDGLRRGRVKASSEIIDIILEGKDVLRELLENLAAGEVTSLEGERSPQPHEPPGMKEALLKGETVGDREQREPGDMEMQVFLQAADQYLDLMEDCLVQMRQGRITRATLEAYLRALRSLRKSAAYVRLEAVEKVISREEELIERFWSGETELSPMVVELLMRASDFVKRAIEEVRESGTKAEATQILADLKRAVLGELGPPRLGEILVSEGRASHEDIQGALQEQKRLGEILMDQRKIRREDLRQALDRQTRLRLEEGIKLESTVRVEASKLDHLVNLVEELIGTRDRLVNLTREGSDPPEASKRGEELKTAILSLEEISDRLHAATMKARMVPIGYLFRKFPRVVRDLARERAKKIDLKILGGATQVDRALVERMGDPLLHLVRNSIDHGIESPRERRRLQKPETGNLILRASQQGQEVVIEIEDDGRGLDPRAIREEAVRRGLVTPAEAERLDNDRSLDLVFLPGFSTAAKVTYLSGRGVGLDVVRHAVQNLHGRIGITSGPEQGVKFTLRLPLTVAVVEVLLVESCGKTVALPATAVKEASSVDPQQIGTAAEGKTITIGDRSLKLVELARFLNLPQGEKERKEVGIVVVCEKDQELGLIVDAIRERQEAVVRAQEGSPVTARWLSEGRLLGTGEEVLILNPRELTEF